MMTRSQHATLATEVAEAVVKPEQTVGQVAEHIFNVAEVMRNIMLDSASMTQQELHGHIQFATELQRAYLKRATLLRIL
jgi:hypothetical protein